MTTSLLLAMFTLSLLVGVLCIGRSGHLALEMFSKSCCGDDARGQTDTREAFAGTDCGGCRDVLTFDVTLASPPMPNVPATLRMSVVSPAPMLHRTPVSIEPAPGPLLVEEPASLDAVTVELSSTVLLC